MTPENWKRPVMPGILRIRIRWLGSHLINWRAYKAGRTVDTSRRWRRICNLLRKRNALSKSIVREKTTTKPLTIYLYFYICTLLSGRYLPFIFIFIIKVCKFSLDVGGNHRKYLGRYLHIRIQIFRGLSPSVMLTLVKHLGLSSFIYFILLCV